MFFAASISQAQTNTPKKKSAATGKKKGPTTQAFDPPVFEPEQCTQERATENSGRWLFRSATIQSGGLLKTYWLGRNYEIDPLNPQPPAPPIENNYVGINTSDPSSILDVHIPENVDADPLYGLSVSTGLGCSKVGLVSGDDNPSWVGSYSFDGNGHHPFQVRAGIYGNFWNPSSGTYIHLNPQNERIGINTSTPAATLDVNGDAKADNLKLTQVPEGLVGINGSGFISPATKSQIATLLTNGGTENNIAAFETDGGLKNSYIKQSLLTSGSRSIGFKFDESLKTHFHFSKWQTLHADGGTSQFAYNSYTHWNGTNWVSEKVEPTLGASTMIQTNDGTIFFRNLKATENPATDWKTVLTMTPDRNVGVGTSSPDAKLSIYQLSPPEGQNRMLTLRNGYNNSTLNEPTLSFSNDPGTYKWNIGSQVAGPGYFRIGRTYGESDQEYLRITDNGNVGIGTINPISKLHVKGDWLMEDEGSGPKYQLRLGAFQPNPGSGHADARLLCEGKGVFKELIVYSPNDWVNWPDYVFETNYCLPSLSEVEQFITTEKHLPEVPSQEEINQKGVDILEMNKILLKKVEELTLHLIRMQKEIDGLKSSK